MPERPRFIGGPKDGRYIEERFPEGHPLHGTLPNAVMFPTNKPPLSPGAKHLYEFIGGDYVYQGTA